MMMALPLLRLFFLLFFLLLFLLFSSFSSFCSFSFYSFSSFSSSSPSSSSSSFFLKIQILLILILSSKIEVVTQILLPAIIVKKVKKDEKQLLRNSFRSTSAHYIQNVAVSRVRTNN